MKTHEPRPTAITKSSSSLLRVEEACALLAKCRTIDEAKGIRDKAEAIKAYLRTQSASLDAQNDAAEIKLRAERRLGELLSEQKAKGERDTGRGGDRKSRLHAATVIAPRLKDLGIEKTAAARWQQLAKIPEERFEGYVKEQRAEPQGEITSAGLRSEHKTEERTKKRRTQIAQVEVYRPPAGEFAIVVFDWSWKYGDSREGSEKARNGAGYPRQELAEIETFAFPFAKDCLIGCWITNNMLIDGTWEVMRLALERLYAARPKQMRTWRKTGADGESEVTGLGKAFRGDTEHLILLERGTVTYNETGANHAVPILRTGFDAPRGRGSAKPDKAYEDLLAICPMRPVVELHARDPRPGWVVSGAELKKKPRVEGWTDPADADPRVVESFRKTAAAIVEKVNGPAKVERALRWKENADRDLTAIGRRGVYKIWRAMTGAQLLINDELYAHYDSDEAARGVAEQLEAGWAGSGALAEQLPQPKKKRRLVIRDVPEVA